MYYLITFYRVDWGKKFVVIKAKKPLMRLPKSLDTVLRPHATYDAIELTTFFERKRRVVKELIDENINIWMSEEEFKELMIKAINLAYDDNSTREQQIQLLHYFIEREPQRIIREKKITIIPYRMEKLTRNKRQDKIYLADYIVNIYKSSVHICEVYKYDLCVVIPSDICSDIYNVDEKRIKIIADILRGFVDQANDTYSLITREQVVNAVKCVAAQILIFGE